MLRIKKNLKKIIFLVVIFTFPATLLFASSHTDSTFFSTYNIESYGTYSTESDGDLWPSCWSDDDALYTANGDGKGFFMRPPQDWADIVMNKVSGHPDNNNVSGVRLSHNMGQVWSDPDKYNRKPTGMACVDGDIYMAVQDLNKEDLGLGFDNPAFNDAPAATILKSTDKGKTWTWDTTAPMFDNHIFTTIMFLDYGKNNQHAIDNYVYAYALDYNWRDSYSDTVPDPTKLFLARVPKTSIMDRSTWEFYTGTSNGIPTWTSDISLKAPVLEDTRRVYTDQRDPDAPSDITVLSQGSIVYNAPLDRYMYSSWTEFTFEFYEAPQPWGPWKLYMTKDYGGYPWHTDKNGGYATTIPSKFISADGKNMWVQSNTFEGGTTNYSFNLRKFAVEPFVDSTPSNTKDNTNNLAMTGNGVQPIEKVFHYGYQHILNDGVTQNQTDDSWDQENKLLDWWGYHFNKKYNINEVVYTTGDMFFNGGWFSSGLKVQVRQGFSWVDVTGLNTSPTYPYNDTAGPNKVYTFTFDDTWGDGVRIIGEPAEPSTGGERFTSISELEIYYK